MPARHPPTALLRKEEQSLQDAAAVESVAGPFVPAADAARLRSDDDDLHEVLSTEAGAADVPPEAALAQLDASGAAAARSQETTQLGSVDTGSWFLSEPRESCEETCSMVGLRCDLAPMKMLAREQPRTVQDVAHIEISGMQMSSCKKFEGLMADCPEEGCFFPGVYDDGRCTFFGPWDEVDDIKCEAKSLELDFRRLCACKYEHQEDLACDSSLVGTMARPLLRGGQISASSCQWDLPDYKATTSNPQACSMQATYLDNDWKPQNESAATWRPSPGEVDQGSVGLFWKWNEPKNFRWIITKGAYDHVDQGRGEDCCWVTSFTLFFSMDHGKSWEKYPRTFRGNSNVDDTKAHKLDPKFTATAIYIRPLQWSGQANGGVPKMRVDFKGCTGRLDPIGLWSECAGENEVCSCNGIAWFGSRRRTTRCMGSYVERDLGNFGSALMCDEDATWDFTQAWDFKEVNGQIKCDAKSFNSSRMSEQQAQAQCGCYKGHDWMSSQCSSRRRGTEADKAFQTPGVNRRRRWCGYGPRDCQVGMWSNYSACYVRQGCAGKCKQYKNRTRQFTTPHYNGGVCELSTEEEVDCDAPDKEVVSACEGSCSKEVQSPV